MNSVQLIEKSKTLNQEKLVLKQRLNELENEYINKMSELREELQNNVHKYHLQTELDEITIENCNTTISNLQVLNMDVKSQLNDVENLYYQEKTTSKSLQTRLEEINKVNKENFESLKIEHQRNQNKIDILSKERLEIDKKAQNEATRISALELQNSTLEAEVKLAQEETQRLRDKLSEYEEIIAMLRRSIESFIKGKDNEISRIKGILGTLEEKLLQTITDYEILLAQNQELNQTLDNITVMNYEKRIESLELELGNSEKARRELHGRLSMSEEQIKNYMESKLKEEMNLKMKEYINKYEQTKTELNDLVLKFEDQAKLLSLCQFENEDLKLRLSEHEEVNMRNVSLKEKLKTITEEKYQLNEEMSKTKKQLFTASKELLEKNKLTLEQNKIIKDLEQHIQALEDSLSTAFEDIKRLHLSLEEAKRAEELADLPPVRKNDEIDQKLREIMIKTKVPVKFIRIGEGLYIFGSKRVHVKILNNKLVIRIGGGYMYIEEFIRLYAHQELVKLKNKEEPSIAEPEPEEIPPEVKGPQPLQEESIQGECLIRELEQLRGSEIRVIPNSSSNYDSTPIKKGSADKSCATPEKNRPHVDHAKSFNSIDQNNQSVNENVIYEITPKGGHGGSSVPKGTLNSHRTKTPDPRSHGTHEQISNLKLNEIETRRSSSKTPELTSARESALTSRGGTSRR